jgi:hypothetical protein
MPTDPSTAPTPPAWAELTRKRLRVKLTRSPSTAPKARGHGHLGRVTKGCPGLIEIQPIGHVVQTVPGVAVSDGYIRGGRAPSRVGWRTGRAGLRATGGAFWCVHPQSRAYACSGNALRFNQAGGQQIEAAESRDDPSDQGGDAHWVSSLTRGRAYQQVRRLPAEVLGPRKSQVAAAVRRSACSAYRGAPTCSGDTSSLAGIAGRRSGQSALPAPPRQFFALPPIVAFVMSSLLTTQLPASANTFCAFRAGCLHGPAGLWDRGSSADD